MGSPIPPEDSGPGVASAEPAVEPASPSPDKPPPGAVPPRQAAPAPKTRRRRRGRVLIWTASITAGVVALAAVGLFLVYRHLNGNIQQRDVSGLLGSQPVDLHPQAEDILIIGSDSRFGLSGSYGKNLVTDQSDTMMIMHIAAHRQWSEVMSMPRDSYVSIPACQMGNGQLSG